MGRISGAYDPKLGPHRVDEIMAGLAGRQHGVVAVWQLLERGVSREVVKRRVRSLNLHRLYRGVYAVGHEAVGRRGRQLAAVLSCGPKAVASHRLAGHLHAIHRGAPPLEVTAPRSRAKKEGVLVHRSRVLHPDDHGFIDAVPVTSVARTLVDLADVLDGRRLADAVHEAEVQRAFDLTKIRKAQERVPGRKGRHRLARILKAYAPNPVTRSEAEREFLERLKTHSLPQPQANASLHGYEVDLYWPDRNLVVEVDGAAAHHTRRAFEEDRRRDRKLAKQGVRVLRVTAKEIEEGAADIAAILRR